MAGRIGSGQFDYNYRFSAALTRSICPLSVTATTWRGSGSLISLVRRSANESFIEGLIDRTITAIFDQSTHGGPLSVQRLESSRQRRCLSFAAMQMSELASSTKLSQSPKLNGLFWKIKLYQADHCDSARRIVLATLK